MARPWRGRRPRRGWISHPRRKRMLARILPSSNRPPDRPREGGTERPEQSTVDEAEELE